jgi:hypothetical protein
MEARQFKPYVIVISLMALTSLLLAYTVDVDMVNEPGIRVELPDAIGAWTGQGIRYCQNPEHQQVYLTGDLDDPAVCPDCGAELYMMSLDERRILPPDTIILKKQYEREEGSPVQASIVLSGADRSSIHRPQLCLTGQGQDIVGEWTHEVPLEGRDPLRVRVLDMERTWRGEDGVERRHAFYYAYWFVGQDRETHSHYQRMFWMGYDRVFRNVAHRWAYLAVSGVRDREADQHVAEIDEFIQTMYPRMVL